MASFPASNGSSKRSPALIDNPYAPLADDVEMAPPPKKKDAKITFWCPVDIQKTLQTKDEEKIRSEAREMIDKLWKGEKRIGRLRSIPKSPKARSRASF